MDKLIELLNEYESKLEDMPLTRQRWGEEDWILWRRFMTKEDAERMVISKSFGFIKRLVDNDKIERLAFAESWLLGKYTDFELSYDTPREDYTNMLLMELSIQDNPIEFLISILK